jgi:hypothetical protein
VSGNGKLEIGVDIPTPDEMRAIVAKLPTSPMLRAGDRCS